MKKITVILLVLVLALTFSACAKPSSGSGTSSDSTNGLADTGAAAGTNGTVSGEDQGWIKFDLPDGFEVVRESDQYITVINTKNNKQFIRLTRDYLMGRSLEDLAYGQISNNAEKYSKGADGYFSGISWKVVNYTENGVECRMFFGLAGDGDHFIRITATGLTENDFALQIIMGHLIIDVSEL